MSAIRKHALIELLTLPYTCKQRDIICGQTKVETQNLASHKQGRAINRCEICLSLPRFLLGRRKILRLYWADAIVILGQKNVQVSAIVFYTYPHPLFPIQLHISLHPVLTPHPLYVKNRYEM